MRARTLGALQFSLPIKILHPVKTPTKMMRIRRENLGQAEDHLWGERVTSTWPPFSIPCHVVKWPDCLPDWLKANADNDLCSWRMPSRFGFIRHISLFP